MAHDIETLKQIERKLAKLVMKNRAYIPLFVRIQNEITALTDENDIVERAKAIAADYSAVF